MDTVPTEKLVTAACGVIHDSKPTSDKLIAMNTTMADEMDRLETFKHWPKPHIVSPMALARAGLYYTNRDDYVQCAYCLGNLFNWMVGDNAMEEHRRHFPDCRFIKRVGNRYKCMKCLRAEVEVVFVPCLHITCCSRCAETMKTCPVCRDGIKSSFKVRFCHNNETFPGRIEQCDFV